MHQEKIRDLLSKYPTEKKVIVIYGPTACGKSHLALEIAKSIESEIVSVDARQIYRYMNIGTGKVTKDEKQWIPHHMLDIIDPSEAFSVADFRARTEPILDKLWSEWKTPILCGGTGLYLDSLIYEREYMGKPPDPERRKELEDFREKHGNEALWNKLHALDPVYADMLHVNNWTYVIRGIEIFEETGRSKLEAQHGQKLKYPTLFLTPYDGDRARLYEKINTRVEQMFATWLIEEVWYIMDTFSSHCPWLRTIGYKEVVDYLEWKTTLEDAISLVQQHNRNYAKRQITWNKKYE